MDAAARCFICKTTISPRPGFVPWCHACGLAELEKIRQRAIWNRRLSAMGAKPGAKTKRAERLAAIRETRAPAANDNARPFGT
jgi:hypothetical protein